MCSPSLDRGMVVSLSTMMLLDWVKFALDRASSEMRSSGISVESLVNGQTVIESVASNRSSCTMRTGRGLPA